MLKHLLMLFPLNKILFIFFIILINFSLFGETYTYKRFTFYYKSIDSNLLTNLIDIFDESENFFLKEFNYIPSENIDIKICSSIDEMKQKLNINYWIGGYYLYGNIYLQPLEILIKKKLLKKIIFIEYSHYFIDSFTGNNCPLWFNEMLSYNYFNSVINYDNIPEKEIKIISDYSKFIDLKKNLKNMDLMDKFYHTAILFADYLNNIYGGNFNKKILILLCEKKTFDESILILFNKDIKKLYEDFIAFIN